MKKEKENDVHENKNRTQPKPPPKQAKENAELMKRGAEEKRRLMFEVPQAHGEFSSFECSDLIDSVQTSL